MSESVKGPLRGRVWLGLSPPTARSGEDSIRGAGTCWKASVRGTRTAVSHQLNFTPWSPGAGFGGLGRTQSPNGVSLFSHLQVMRLHALGTFLRWAVCVRSLNLGHRMAVFGRFDFLQLARSTAVQS